MSIASIASLPPRSPSASASLARPRVFRLVAFSCRSANRRRRRPFVARAARGDAALQPVFLGLEALLQAAELGRLLVDDLLGPLLEPVEAAVALEHAAAVQPQQAAGQLAQEGAVVADHQDAAGEARELLFQPLDGRQIEVVGRLVQQQQIRPADQRARQRRAPPFAAGKCVERAAAFQLHMVQHPGDAVVVGVRVVRAGRDIVSDRSAAAQIRILRQIADLEAGLQEALALVELDLAGQRFQDRGLAGAVGADQADALAAAERDIDAGRIAACRRT